MPLHQAQLAWLDTQFVGRERELSLLRGVLTRDVPAQVLYLHGPGGIGKSSLVARLRRIAKETGTSATWLDGRALDPSPASLLEQLAEACGVARKEPGEPLDLGRVLLAYASEPQVRHLVIIDSYERILPLDAWMRDTLVPRLPPNLTLVLAGRNAPSAGWRVLPGWGTLLRALPVTTLDEGEARALLAKRGVPRSRHDDALRVTHGHPLALWLLADTLVRDPHLDLTAPPIDIVRDLIASLVDSGVPSPAHREALEAMVVVRALDEALLAAMLEREDVHDLFGWLASQAWVEVGPHGLQPHELLRDTLDAELRWRNADRRAELARRAADWYSRRFVRVDLSEQARLSVDRAYLHRHLPFVAHSFDWQAMARLRLEVATTADHPAIVDIVRRHEGAAPAEEARRWLASDAGACVVFRDALGEVAHFSLTVRMDQASEVELARDPATRVAWGLINQYGGVREGEAAVHARFWMARDTYQDASLYRAALIFWAFRTYGAMPGLRWMVVTNTLPNEQWIRATQALGIACAPAAGFQVGDHHTNATLLDLRRVTPLEAIDRVLQGVDVAAHRTHARPSASEPLVQLGRDAFDAAVQQALKHVGDTMRLAQSPLVHARLVWLLADAALPGVDRVALLAERLREALEALGRSPTSGHTERVVRATWFSPNDGQKTVADALGLPFGTYRHHLREGTSFLSDYLWALETGSATRPSHEAPFEGPAGLGPLHEHRSAARTSRG